MSVDCSNVEENIFISKEELVQVSKERNVVIRSLFSFSFKTSSGEIYEFSSVDFKSSYKERYTLSEGATTHGLMSCSFVLAGWNFVSVIM